MHLGGTPDLGHLTYCTNIHAAEAWDDAFASLRTHLPGIKAEIAPDRPLGVGLRLAASASKALEDPETMARFRAFLAQVDCYVFTLNGFPYGTFHGQRVKEGAYLPDWGAPERLTYTNTLADQLDQLLPEGMAGSVSTVPGTFKAWATEDRVGAITDNLLSHAAHLIALRQRTGRTITLALEPEPACFLETIEETVDYFARALFGAEACRRIADATGLGVGEAEEALRRHLGVCYDVCHAAVEFEDPAASVAALRTAGIGIFKLQLSAALRIAGVKADSADHLRSFAEPVYLHQTIQNRAGAITRFTDLPDALDVIAAAEGAEWRIHYHVPIFLDRMRDFDTTQAFLREILALHAADPISDHLEVETYTWDVLPDQYRGTPVGPAIARELAWVRERLGA
jgi:sugar phosphate isomerase/epimerase